MENKNDMENKTDCCSNNEYENRGGKAMHEWLKNKFSDVSLSGIQKYVDKPSINIPIYISNNINNIGSYKHIDKNDDNIDDISSYNDNTLTGWVESKLSLFLSNKLVIDNVGNEFNATYPKNGIIDENCELGLPYERFCIKNYRSNDDGSFYCDVLSDIVTDTENKECTITYLFNALLKKTDEIVLKQLSDIDDSYSIKYTETFTYDVVDMNYYINDKEFIPVKVKVLKSKNLSDNGIPLAKFEFTKQKLNFQCVSIIDVKFDDNENKWIGIFPTLKKTFDKYEIIDGKVILYKKGCPLEPYYYQGTIEYDGKEYDSWQKQGDECRVLTEKVINTYKEYSIFRDEYIGLSNIENIDENIYINRGYANAFKPHLALQEVKTMESLMQYGNNVFNIENE